MKPETKKWLDKLVPLLAHLKEGWNVKYKEEKEQLSIRDLLIRTTGSSGIGGFLITPENYSIHVEPRVVYMNDYGCYFGDAEFKPGDVPKNSSTKGVVRFIEDLNWKPDKPNLDADHHLPEPVSKQAADYMKTV